MGMPAAPDPQTLPPHIVVGDIIYWAGEVQGGFSDTWRKVWRPGGYPAMAELPAAKPKPGSACRLLCLLIDRPRRERLLMQLGLIKPRPDRPPVVVVLDEGAQYTELDALDARIRQAARQLAAIGRTARVNIIEPTRRAS